MKTSMIGDNPGTRRPSGRRHVWLLTLLAVLLLPVPALPAAALFVMGTDTQETALVGKWYRRIYAEAFRRMEVPLTVTVVPVARLSAMASSGEVHGQVSRLAIYAETHPTELRVDEVLHEQRLSLFGFDPAGKTPYPRKLEDLAAGKWLVEYRRGILLCEKTLKPLVPADKLSDITTSAQGMNKLRTGRTDLYCDFALNLETELLTPEFRGITGFRPVLDLGLSLQLYPYVHQSRAELAPLLAATLKKMKAEGLIERYFRETQRELEAAR